jgi:Ca2+-binding RTX toxin-like protein
MKPCRTAVVLFATLVAAAPAVAAGPADLHVFVGFDQSTVPAGKAVGIIVTVTNAGVETVMTPHLQLDADRASWEYLQDSPLDNIVCQGTADTRLDCSANDLAAGQSVTGTIFLRILRVRDRNVKATVLDGAGQPTLASAQKTLGVTTTQRCRGQRPTIVGSAGVGGDYLVLRDNNEVVAAGQGDDWVGPESGSASRNDVICGGPGDDRLNGGSGSDQIFGNEGSDLLDGDRQYNPPQREQRGKDRLVGGSGRDTINGWGGEDKLSGGSGEDSCDGGRGHDRLIDQSCEGVVGIP